MRFPDPLEIIVIGRAGQGVVTAGRLIAEAAALHGKYATQTAKTPVAVRDGFAAAHVILSEFPVDYPFVETPYFLIVLDELALSSYRQNVQSGGVILGVTDKDCTSTCTEASITTVRIPIKASGVANGDENLALVGALAALWPMVPTACFLRALNRQPGFSEESKQSLLRGEAAVNRLQGL